MCFNNLPNRSTVQGAHDASDLRNFAFPAPGSSFRIHRDSGCNSGDSRCGLGLSPRSRLHDIYPSIGAHAPGMSDPFVNTTNHNGENSREGSRVHRLRRSVASINLRDGTTTPTASSDSSAVPAGTNHQVPRSATAPNFINGLDGIPEDQPPLDSFGFDRISRWRHTATTLDQSLLHSPITPRRFNEDEISPHHSASQAHLHGAFAHRPVGDPVKVCTHPPTSTSC